VHYQSRPVDSNQNAVHQHLLTRLEKHLRCEYRKPISASSRDIFAEVETLRKQLSKPLILDSGCGTGASTRYLAQQNPHALVVGVDKSSHRLARGRQNGCSGNANNCLLLQVDLVDFWRLAAGNGWRLEKHYLLYPNPWPKARHLQRRWYAHPVFPELLRLRGELEMRCNWLIYAEEFQTVMNYFAPDCCKLEEYNAETALSLFEQKYLASGHRLYRCRCFLDNLAIGNQHGGAPQPIL